MPATYSIKRNSLSSKWGVWSVDADAESPVEKLVAELKTKEEAEVYCGRIEAGESPESIMASLTAKKPKQSGGGLFGKLFGRGNSGEPEAIEAPVSNPVIEIETQPEVSPEQASAAASLQELTPAVSATKPAIERPSKFQVVEQPAKVQPVEPIPAVEADIETPKPAAFETDTRLDEMSAEPQRPETAEAFPGNHSNTEPRLAPQVADIPEATDVSSFEQGPAQSVADVRAVEEPYYPGSVQASAPEPEPVKAQQSETSAPVQSRTQINSESEDSRDDSLLVDWTFTPPPDVTPAELKASGQKPVSEPAQQRNGMDPEYAPQPAQQNDPGSERVVVEICVSKGLKEGSIGDPRVSDKKYNSIASKEYTEVSKVFAAGNSPDSLREELTHLAAVCLAWADAIQKRQADKGANAA